MLKQITLVMTLAAVALSATAAPSSALLSLGVGTGATLTPFRPGSTAVGSGSLTVLSTLAWTLKVRDGGIGAGRMQAAAGGCTGSDAQLSNAMTLTATIGGNTTAVTTISGSDQLLASGAGVISSFVVTTNYAVLLPAAQVLLTGCAYSLTATYTLQ